MKGKWHGVWEDRSNLFLSEIRDGQDGAKPSDLTKRLQARKRGQTEIK
jgi:hypothetical protein